MLDSEVVVPARGNYLRKRVHRLDAPVDARRLRLVIFATHGAAEVRVYG